MTITGFGGLHPAAVYLSTTLQPGPIWADESDATSTTISISSGGSNTHTRGWLETSTVDPATVTDISIVARYKAETTEGVSDFPIVVSIGWGNGSTSAPFTDVLAPRYVHSQPIITEDQWFLTDDDYALIGLDKVEVANRLTGAPVGEPLAAGQRCLDFSFLAGSIDPPETGTRTLTVYEAEVRVWYEIPSPEAPITRLFPRDRGGIGGGNRIYPRSKTNRIVGGYH